MRVQSVLAQKGNRVATIRPEASIAAAADQLKREGVGALVASEDGESLSGILSERDIVRGMADHGERLKDMTVADLMTREVQTCGPNDKLDDVMAEMSRSRFRHLPVVTDGKLCGIISIGDVVKNRLDELESETSVLKDFIAGRG